MGGEHLGDSHPTRVQLARNGTRYKGISHIEGIAFIRVQVDPKLLAELIPMSISHPSRAQAGDDGQEWQEVVHLLQCVLER